MSSSSSLWWNPFPFQIPLPRRQPLHPPSSSSRFDRHPPDQPSRRPGGSPTGSTLWEDRRDMMMIPAVSFLLGLAAGVVYFVWNCPFGGGSRSLHLNEQREEQGELQTKRARPNAALSFARNQMQTFIASIQKVIRNVPSRLWNTWRTFSFTNREGASLMDLSPSRGWIMTISLYTSAVSTLVFVLRLLWTLSSSHRSLSPSLPQAQMRPTTFASGNNTPAVPSSWPGTSWWWTLPWISMLGQFYLQWLWLYRDHRPSPPSDHSSGRSTLFSPWPFSLPSLSLNRATTITTSHVTYTTTAAATANTNTVGFSSAAANSATGPSHLTSISSASSASGGERFLELLVHNVSHTDLVLSLEVPSPPDPPGPTHPLETTQAMDETVLVPVGMDRCDDDQGTNVYNNNDDEGDDDDPFCLCRPRFSCFDLYSRQALEYVRRAERPPSLQPPSFTCTKTRAAAQTTETAWKDPISLLFFPRYERSLQSPRFSIKQRPTGQNPTPTGFELYPPVSDSSEPPFHQDLLEVNLQNVRVRGRDHSKLAGHVATPGQTPPLLRMRHVFFPLLATLLPRWQQQIAEKQYDTNRSTVKRVLFLVTGVGTPRNWTHSVNGNSTEACAELMKHFLQRIDPALTIVQIHSETNIFRYDENLVFVERELMPTINAYRDAHCRGLPYPDEVKGASSQRKEWSNIDVGCALAQEQQLQNLPPFNADLQKSMSITVSFADGSPARTYAIQTSLRPYKPTYFHFWQLKTFWHESKIVDDDIEVHSFEAMETSPAVDVDRCTDPWITLVVSEMKAFKQEMQKTLASKQHDLHRFWLRKTHKPVLAVLLVQTQNMTRPVLYRGTNMEVSMPTGSLCAERNVIGSALAENPGLRREDLKMIAVLAVPEMEEAIVATASDGAPMLRRVSSINSYASMVTLDASDHPDRKTSIGSEHDEWILPSSTVPGVQPPEVSFTMMDGSESTVEAAPANSGTSTPLRRIALFSKTAGPTRKPKRTLLVKSTTVDRNPLRPCGACNEWLKKIAESNPYFRIITFTDTDCNGVYITPCQE